MPSGLSFGTALLGARAYSESFGAHTQNLAAAGAVAGRPDENFINAFELNGGVKGVDTSTLRHLDQIGLPVQSSIPTHFTVGGTGYVPVNNASSGGNLGYTRNCTFAPDGDLNFVNGLGENLQVFLVNADGSPTVADVTSTAGLTTLNVSGLALSAVATTNVSLAGVQLPADLAAAPVGTVKTSSVPVIDSTGNIKNLTFTWTRVDQTTIGAPATADLYNALNTLSTQAWDLTISGPAGSTIGAPYAVGSRIEFDGHGNPTAFNTNGANVGTATPSALNITWGGGTALASAITLDLGTVGTNAGVVSAGNTYSAGSSTKDGSQPGQYQSIAFGPDGYGTVTYSNNAQVKYCRVPVAIFNNTNGLSEVRTGVFTPTATSGSYQLFFPGAGGTGSLSAGTYEGSAVDSTQVYVQMIQDQQRFVGNLKAIETIHQMLDRLGQV